MIEIDGKIYRNLEEQVRKNKEDIESIDTNVTSNTSAITNISNRLDNLDLTYATNEDVQNLQSQINTKANQDELNSTNLKVNTLESNVTQLTPQVAKSLKTPMSAPASTELVAVDTSNGQAMISIGDGLTIENDTLKLSGGQQQQINIDNDSITKNSAEELQAVKLKNAFTNINTTVTKSDFSGATKLSKEQYYELLQYGQIEVDGQIITYSDGEFYITPDLSEDFDDRISDLEASVTQLAPQVARALKTPMSAPSSTQLVSIDTSNSQAMISIGAGLVIENDTLKSTGGVQIIDNLTSTSISAALSANQGRVLSNTISTVTSSVDSNTEQIEFLQADMAGKTNVTINNVHQDYINFSSDPQTQINAKANQSALDSTNANVTSLTNNKANKDLSNVTYPQLTPDGIVHTSSGYTTYMTTDGNTWYMKFPNGFKIMGGYVISSSSSQQVITVNMQSGFFQDVPTVFKQAGYSGYYNNPVSWDYLQVWDVTTSSFKTPTYNASNGGNFKWVAFGR